MMFIIFFFLFQKAETTSDTAAEEPKVSLDSTPIINSTF